MRKGKKQPSKPSKTRKPENPFRQVVNTEGINYVINWDTFPVMGFVFIRCIETERVVQELRSRTSRLGIKIAIRVGIRNGYWGVGVWRTK